MIKKTTVESSTAAAPPVSASAIADPADAVACSLESPAPAKPVSKRYLGGTAMLLNSELDLTLRPMKYPEFFQLYRDSVKNIWSTDEIDFSVEQYVTERSIPK